MTYKDIMELPFCDQFRKMTNSSIVELISNARVDLFHQGLLRMVEMLIEKMPELDEFEVDFRGWNRQFAMEDFKKKLSSGTFIPKFEYSIMMSKKEKVRKEEEEEKKRVKVICLV